MGEYDKIKITCRKCLCDLKLIIAEAANRGLIPLLGLYP